jgi:hypothetical protein
VDEFLELAVDVATSAGKLLCEGIDRIAWVKHKGEINLVIFSAPIRTIRFLPRRAIYRKKTPRSAGSSIHWTAP